MKNLLLSLSLVLTVGGNSLAAETDSIKNDTSFSIEKKQKLDTTLHAFPVEKESVVHQDTSVKISPVVEDSVEKKSETEAVQPDSGLAEVKTIDVDTNVNPVLLKPEASQKSVSVSDSLSVKTSLDSLSHDSTIALDTATTDSATIKEQQMKAMFNKYPYGFKNKFLRSMPKISPDSLRNDSTKRFTTTNITKQLSKETDSIAVDSINQTKKQVGKKSAKKDNIYQESRINTIDDMKGKYRSPKKALFMSLLVPGLGQAYVGHYIRGSLYFALEIGLGISWRHYVVVKHDRQVKKYESFADEHWSNKTHEDEIKDIFSNDYSEDPEIMKVVLPHREAFCNSIFHESSSSLETCLEFSDQQSGTIKPYSDLPHYIDAQEEPEDRDDVSKYRQETYQDLHTFYELIGKYDEFITGWDDAQDVEWLDSSVTGTSLRREDYRQMRRKASEYSRMQAWFLGGIVLNHLVSAVDAAISARFHNKKLYQTDVKWYDRVKLDSYFVFNGSVPFSEIRMRLPF
ncbi:MAG: hypothetical protein HQK83_06850 [Fibrobacteria bacterium]|nr:hypothetical protein [Fibrobacteria bacterium]